LFACTQPGNWIVGLGKVKLFAYLHANIAAIINVLCCVNSWNIEIHGSANKKLMKLTKPQRKTKFRLQKIIAKKTTFLALNLGKDFLFL